MIAFSCGLLQKSACGWSSGSAPQVMLQPWKKKRGEFLLEEGFICVDLISDKPNSI
jgi:hypothetical protein